MCLEHTIKLLIPVENGETAAKEVIELVWECKGWVTDEVCIEMRTFRGTEKDLWHAIVCIYCSGYEFVSFLFCFFNFNACNCVFQGSCYCPEIHNFNTHKKNKTMPRNVRSHRTCVNHKSICSEIGLSYVKGVLVTRYHLLPMFLLTPCGLPISKSLHGSGCVLEQQSERCRGASVQRSFLDFSFYIYHI